MLVVSNLTGNLMSESDKIFWITVFTGMTSGIAYLRKYVAYVINLR